MAKETLIKERESKTDIAYRVMLKKKKDMNTTVICCIHILFKFVQ